MSETEVCFQPVPQQDYGNPIFTADWVIAHAMKGYSAGLCSQSDARFMAWSQYVKAMGLRPQMDAKDFYKIFDRQWETAYSGPSKIEPSHEPKAKAESSTQWVKVTSVDRVWRVNPKDRNDNSVYFTVNRRGKTHAYIAEGSIADYIEGFYRNKVYGTGKQRELVSKQLNRLAQKVIDKLAGKASEPAPATPPILTAPPELAADVLGAGQTPVQAAPKPKKQPAAQAPQKPITKPKLTTEQRKYLAAHKIKAGYTRWVEFCQVDAATAIREAKSLERRGEKVQIEEVASKDSHPAYTVYMAVCRSPEPAASPTKQPAAKPKPKPAPDMPPILTAPPELAADVLGMGPMGLTPTPAAPRRKPAARTTRKQPKKTAAAKTRKTAKKAAKPKAKKTAATPKLTASQREYLAIQGFVMVKRGGKYVKVTG